MEWKFKEKTKQDFVADPVQAAFFTTEDVGNLTDALVRECIQNSIDARINRDIQNFLIMLRFTFGVTQNGFSENNKFLKNLGITQEFDKDDNTDRDIIKSIKDKNIKVSFSEKDVS